VTSKAVDRCFNIAELRKRASKKMPAPMFHYIDGGADDEWTLRRNTEAFEEVEFLPKVLVDVTETHTATRLFGQDIEWPFFLSPTALSRLFHHEGETAVARAAYGAGTIYSLSSFSSMSIEEVGKLTPGPKAFQVYVLKDRGLSREFVQRAKDAGFVALELTVDVPGVSGNRERDIVTGMTVPPKLSLMSLIDIAMHPAWVYRHLTTAKVDMANVAHNPPPGSDSLGGIIEYLNAQLARGVTWDDAEWMIKEWGGPFAIKGVVRPEDAKRCIDIGASAVMLSNHGGRQLGCAPAPFDTLKAVRDAVGDALEIVVDGGVRRGSHILKAMALGATACSGGRAYLYGLGAGGEAGVVKALSVLRDEMKRDMALMGISSIADLNESMVRRVSSGWST
jgi:L-lactate dehydrogenase (cytochrome)